MIGPPLQGLDRAGTRQAPSFGDRPRGPEPAPHLRYAALHAGDPRWTRQRSFLFLTLVPKSEEDPLKAMLGPPLPFGSSGPAPPLGTVPPTHPTPHGWYTTPEAPDLSPPGSAHH
uniref:Uncharacterized protein n=1 Tax=Eutreptiella gymnastica TaxID=73025 RepID=A0A7S1NPK5_9EUGL|mmetsp:Transcript_6757/g.12109  ORF Transcript_6757/g.12109 Transcript_6757/m.12109 type:complete len:115 (+) Transcript_6757:131-475(+)